MEKCNGGGDTNIIKDKCNGVVGNNKNLTEKHNDVDSNNQLPDKCHGQNHVILEKQASRDQNSILKKEKCNNFVDNSRITEKRNGEEINDNNISQENWDHNYKKNNDLMDDNHWNENIR